MPSANNRKAAAAATTWPFAALGAVLSMYALHVERKISDKPPEEEFTALCDIESIGASCSSAFAMPEGHIVSYLGIVAEGHLLDLPNPLIGLIYYAYWLVLRPLPLVPPTVTVAISTLAMMASIFLAWRLLVLGELCVLCWSTHAINLRLVIDAYRRLLLPKEEEQPPATEPALKGPPKIKRI